MDAATILTALADLAPARRDRVLDVTTNGRLMWLTDPDRAPRTRTAERLAATDALHQDERLLRRGWVFVVGSTDVDGLSRRVCMPLLSEPVRMRRGLSGYSLIPAGDLEITPLIDDPDRAEELELDGGNTEDWLRRNPDLNGWIRAAAAAAGLEIGRILQQAPPRSRMRDSDPGTPAGGSQQPAQPAYRLVAVKRAGVYVARDVFSASQRETLRSWAARPGLESTALASVYGVDDRTSPDSTCPGGEVRADAQPTDVPNRVLSPLPLDEAQVEVVRRARTERVTVVSGPPGSGKSHAVVAAALDVVDRGGSVLLATQSPHAADVLGQMLQRHAGVTPVLFGDAEHRDRIAAELARGVGAGSSAATLRRDRQAVAAALDRVRELTAAITAALETEQRAAELSGWEPLLPALVADAPGAFADGTDLDAAWRLAEHLAEPATGPPAELAPSAPAWPYGSRRDTWRNRWRAWYRARRSARQRRWVRRRLHTVLRAGPVVPVERLRAAITAGRAAGAAAQLAAGGGTDLAAAWRTLHEAEADLAQTVGVAMRHRASSAGRWDRAARRSAAALAGALRAGRNRRRTLLAGMNGEALVRGMPLWVGTASDVDELLPPVPGLFDLVIVDEASHLDQLRAAPVLARANRAAVVGDPRQLRFVSFVADVDVAATLHRHGLDDRVDVRRMSAFDLASGAAPVTWLDRHYRSAPHLIEFSARRFYAGQVSVATRHPANDALDVIEVVRVTAEGGGAGNGSTGDGVKRSEVAAAVQAVRDLAAAGVVGIALITPFRAQADALEAAVVDTFPLAALERLALRVGTVHAFQGSEAGTVVVSLGLTDDDPPARLRFVSDPQLFNVMVTRARERMVVVTSLTGPDGVIGDYLAFAGSGPGRVPAPRRPAVSATGDRSSHDGGQEWITSLATELRRAGVTVRRDYPVGGWTVDLVIGDEAAAVGLCCRVHPDGIAAHLARQRLLAGTGWRLMDAFASRWSGDPGTAAVALTGELRRGPAWPVGRTLPGVAPLCSTTDPPERA